MIISSDCNMLPSWKQTFGFDESHSNVIVLVLFYHVLYYSTCCALWIILTNKLSCYSWIDSKHIKEIKRKYKSTVMYWTEWIFVIEEKIVSQNIREVRWCIINSWNKCSKNCIKIILTPHPHLHPFPQRRKNIFYPVALDLDSQLSTSIIFHI